MEKEKNVYEMFNDMDELLESIKIDEVNQEKQTLRDFLMNKEVPEMPKIYFDNDENPVIYKELTPDEKELIKNIEEEEKRKKIESSVPEKKVKRKRKSKKNKSNKKWVITFGILDGLAIICLFLMYGPISYFRNLWVTSAMTTMNHRYLAYIFFNEKQINTIMSNNIVIEVEGDTNQEEIEFNEEEIIEYASFEEEQVLKRDEGNDLYKVVPIEGNGYKGNLLVIYDPSKLQLIQTPNLRIGKTIETFVREYGAVAGTNAGGFVYSDAYGYTPTGTVIIDGVVVNDSLGTGWGGGIIGFTNDNVLVLTKSTAQQAIEMGIRDAVSFGPFLIVNGVPSQFRGNGGYGVAPRTAIGQRQDGIVLLLVIDGRRAGHSLGVDMVELTNIMLRYGAYNASNLDGGGSSTLVVNGKTLSVAGGYGYSGDRYLHNAWLLFP